jgi:hypothetical protein
MDDTTSDYANDAASGATGVGAQAGTDTAGDASAAASDYANDAASGDMGEFTYYEPIYSGADDPLPDSELAGVFGRLALARRILGAVALVIFLVGVGWLVTSDRRGSSDTEILTVVIVFIASVIALALIYASIDAKAKKLVSENITDGLLKEVFASVRYDYKSHIDRETIRDSELIPRWTSCSGSDLVHAKYRGLDITFSDIELTHEESRGDDDTSTTVTDFLGQWVICRTARLINADVWLIERGFEMNLFGRKSDIETENIEFNKKYRIHTDDPHTAFLVLTPHFMEYINQMDARANGRTYLWFDGDNVHVAIHNKRNLFDDSITSSVFNPASFDSLRMRFRHDIAYITGIVDELLRNEYLFGETK